MSADVDVAIIGGGPAGSTIGSLLAKYNPSLKVLILEREKFPRDHVGESQLPVIGQVLDEMGAWDKIEAANFPIKVGATYRWGRNQELWDFDFLPHGDLKPVERPGKHEGQRLFTAFQVDRAIYDEILLDHAAELGCEVRQEIAVRSVERTGDHVDRLILSDGSSVTAKHYVDASGHAGTLRRAMGVEVIPQTTLQNIALWDYWQNAEWAVEIGVGGTRIQVMAQSFGWIWFIPLGPTRTSIGLVVPASYYKESGERPEDLYRRAILSDPRIAPLLKESQCEGKFHTTKDWSFVASRITGENWFLAGESAGFADPILSAGMSLTHVGAKDVAYAILALERGDFEPEWIRSQYDIGHRAQIKQHIRFADYWYTHNGIFSELKSYVQEIAGDAGLSMTPEEAWQWFGQGGFIDHHGRTGFGSFSVAATKELSAVFVGSAPHHEIVGKTHFKIDLEGAEEAWLAVLADGKMTRQPSYRRNGKVISGANLMGWLIDILRTEKSYTELTHAAAAHLTNQGVPKDKIGAYSVEFFDSLEAMVSDGWVTARIQEGATPVPTLTLNRVGLLHPNRDPVKN